MVKSKIDGLSLEDAVSDLGLAIFRAFSIEDCPAVLIGNLGGAMWSVFTKSPEYSDGEANPLDRWSQRVISSLAHQHGAEAIFPFEKPFRPFQKYLAQASGMQPSPLGIYIHPTFGLSVGVRGALIFPKRVSGLLEDDGEERSAHPCDDCSGKPCLTTCPVDAFEGGLNVERCFAHLDSATDPDCMAAGCAARNACPIGKEHAYSSEQIQFHMKAYRGVK